jgi:hypothetical protein
LRLIDGLIGDSAFFHRFDIQSRRRRHNDAFVGDEEGRKLTQFVAIELSVVADQDRQVRSLIQTEAQMYRDLSSSGLLSSISQSGFGRNCLHSFSHQLRLSLHRFCFILLVVGAHQV